MADMEAGRATSSFTDPLSTSCIPAVYRWRPRLSSFPPASAVPQWGQVGASRGVPEGSPGQEGVPGTTQTAGVFQQGKVSAGIRGKAGQGAVRLDCGVQEQVSKGGWRHVTPG